jgi:hypothetical protein
MSSPEVKIITTDNSWSSTSVIAWITFILLIIFIIIIIFFFFFRPTVVDETVEFFGANYRYGDISANIILTNNNYIYIIPKTATNTSVFTITANAAGNPGRTFLIKNDSTAQVKLQAGAGVSLILLNGNTAASDTLDSFKTAMYITDRVAPNTVFRRLF